MRPYQGPPGELWLAPRRPLSLQRLALLALGALIALICGCTGTGSSCSSDDACPTGWSCAEGRCEPPPPPPPAPAGDDEPVLSWEEAQHVA